MAERTIRTEIWDDPKFKALQVPQKLFFVYLFTNRHAHISGIYYLPDVFITKELGIQTRWIPGLWDSVTGLKLALRDEEKEMVFVVNMLEIQTHGCKVSEKIKEGIARHLPTLHRSVLINDFLTHYKELNIPYTIPYPIGYDIPPVVDNPRTVVHRPSVVSESENNKKIWQEGFAQFWALLPSKRKLEKRDTIVAWNEKCPPQDLIQSTLAKVLAAAKVYYSTTELQFALWPKRWVERQRWEDEALTESNDEQKPRDECVSCGYNRTMHELCKALGAENFQQRYKPTAPVCGEYQNGHN